MYSDLKLLELNKRGLIPGPLESEEEFKLRISSLEKFFENPDAHFKNNATSSPLPFVSDINRSDLDWVTAKLVKTYDIAPDWIVSTYTNKDLYPWQGAVCWVFELKGVPMTFMQFREKLKKGSYLKIYDRDEILVHECAHAARMAFEEPIFEEIFAYISSVSFFRRVFGPIFRKNKEIGIFFSLLILGSISSSLFPLPLAYLLFLLFRLIKIRMILNRAARRLFLFLKTKKRARSVLFRLTDSEIKMFSRMSPDKIGNYAKKMAATTLRWKMIYLAYFLKK